MIKQYIGQHQELYDGQIKGATIDGTWTIHEGLWHYSSKGAFYLERQCPKPIVTKGTRREVGMVQIGEMQEWAGYYEQQGEKSNMSADIIFTDNQDIYGNGMDSVGPFTWLGCLSTLI
jgi:hypothetical protein